MNITLYEAEKTLAAFLDTEALVSPELEFEFQCALREALRTTKDKRDSIQRFLVHCESQAELCRQEEQRIAARRSKFEDAQQRLEAYVTTVIQQISEPDDKGHYPKLEGNTCTLSLRRNPASVAILDESAVPDDFKTVTITLPAAVVQQIGTELAFAESEHMDAWIGARGSVAVSKTAVKKALASGPVAGAEMRLGAYRLEVK